MEKRASGGCGVVVIDRVSQVLIDIGNPQKDTCQTPEQALAEVRQALNFVSSKMNRGQQLLEENMDEMKWINRYIK